MDRFDVYSLNLAVGEKHVTVFAVDSRFVHQRRMADIRLEAFDIPVA